METDLHKIRLFSTLPADIIEILNKHFVNRKYKKGSMVIWAQDECKAVYFVQSGMIEVFHLSLSGREQTVKRINPA